jgi:hypothetical protein
MEASEARWAALYARANDAGADDLDLDALGQAWTDATGAIVDRMIPMTARTLEGIRVKARAVLWCRGDGSEPPDLTCYTTEERLGDSIVRDLLAGRAQA